MKARDVAREERERVLSALREMEQKEQEDYRFHIRDAERLEAQARSARECAKSSFFRADGLAVAIQRLSGDLGKYLDSLHKPKRDKR